MIWQTARVVSRDAERLTLHFSTPEICQRCVQGQGCGAGGFARLFSRKEIKVVLPLEPLEPALADDDWVRVGVEPQHLARAAALHYGLPLFGFLAGALAGHAVMSGGLVRDVTALAAGLAGFLLAARLVSRRPWSALQPVLERLSCVRGDTKSSFS